MTHLKHSVGLEAREAGGVVQHHPPGCDEHDEPAIVYLDDEDDAVKLVDVELG
jgi:hypothetical protein